MRIAATLLAVLCLPARGWRSRARVRPTESQCRVAVKARRRADRQVYAPRARGMFPIRPSGDSARSGDTTEPL